MIKIKNNAQYMLLYIAFLIPSFLFVGVFFTTVIADNLWYEWDSLPIIDLVTFPSVHTEAGAHFIASPAVVYFTWFFFLVIAFLLPAVMTKLVMKKQ